MYKKKTILTAILLIIFFFSGIFLKTNAEEQKPETPTAEAQLNTEEISPQPPKSPKKDSVPKKEKTKNNNKNSTDAHKKNENENTNAKNTENKEKSESESEKQKEIPKPKKEEKNLDLPNVNNSEVELNPYFSQISQNTQEKSILKTLISWGLILVGIILILKVIISNRKIPKNYTINKKNKHSAISHKRNHVNYKL